MTQGWVRVVVASGFLALVTAVGAFAQGSSTASISGVVVDADGAVVPGATIVVKNIQTGETVQHRCRRAQGIFSVPALITGTYSVPVSLQGFKTAVLNNVVVNSGVPASVRATLEVGGLTETGHGAGQLRAGADADRRRCRPCSTRARCRACRCRAATPSQFVVFLPGVTTAGGTRDSIVNGLPQSTINMTLDGVNIQDNTLKTHRRLLRHRRRRASTRSRRSRSPPRHPAPKRSAAARRRFAIRPSRAPTSCRGGVFHQYRSDSLNTNTWFNKRDNLPKPELLRISPASTSAARSGCRASTAGTRRSSS